MKWGLTRKTEWHGADGPDAAPQQVSYLTLRGWGVAFMLVLVLIWAVPAFWYHLETFPEYENYRIPFAVSEDYWMMRQCISRAKEREAILVFGDSVVWGQYAKPGQTMTACLNHRLPAPARCENLGLDGGHPVGLLQLVRGYGRAVTGQKVVIYFNPLWMSAPLFDMKGEKVQYLFHPRLLPQFDKSLKCYEASIRERVSICLERALTLMQLERHLRLSCLDGMKWEDWILGSSSNHAKVVLGRTLPIPDEQAPVEPVCWSNSGAKVLGTDWIPPSESRQVAAFFELIRLLRARHNSVLVIVGSYNTHMLPPENAAVYQDGMAEVRSRLREQGFEAIALPVLSSPLYGDASHPLPEGYEWIADYLVNDKLFQDWVGFKGGSVQPARPVVPKQVAAEGAPVKVLASQVKRKDIPQVAIRGGRFRMGDARGREDEAPHWVVVHSFLMDRDLVSQDCYEAYMGRNPARHKGPDLPVEQVRWSEAAEFCNRSSESEGLTPCYDLKTGRCDFTANGYRLPTEAEWEYACRAGADTAYPSGDDPATLDDYVWYKGNAGGKTRPVGHKRANAWGLHDMGGNVWQWCNDWYGIYEIGPGDVIAPAGPPTGMTKVLRGGAYDSPAERCRSAYRFKAIPHYQDVCEGYNTFGFRRVRSQAP